MARHSIMGSSHSYEISSKVSIFVSGCESIWIKEYSLIFVSMRKSRCIAACTLLCLSHGFVNMCRLLDFGWMLFLTDACGPTAD